MFVPDGVSDCRGREKRHFSTRKERLVRIFLARKHSGVGVETGQAGADL